MPESDPLQNLLANSPLPARDLLQRLNISQPTLSRRALEAGYAVLRYGQARQSSYALRRTVAGQATFPLYQISESGQVQALGEIIPIEPQGYVVKWQMGVGLFTTSDTYFTGLPWWLDDMRPQGFLGRAFVHQQATRLGLPPNLALWRDDHVLTALAAVGEDGIGNLIVGDAALSRWLAHSSSVAILREERIKHYPHLAQQALGGEIVGSSAGGEQPKFLANVQQDESIAPVLVKFTAPEANAVTRRWGSLLLAEHLALKTLAEEGLPAVASEWLAFDQQYFLEVQRFDRNPSGGRYGMVSLSALDNAFIGQADANWSVIAAHLAKQGYITPETDAQIQRLYAFGRLIGNSDMHGGNLSFFQTGMKPLRLTPSYDMLPMAFAPRASGLIPQAWSEWRLTTPPALRYWQEMLPLAQCYWQRVAEAAQPDATFASVAERCLQHLHTIQQRLG
jgi:hypothetical protein